MKTGEVIGLFANSFCRSKNAFARRMGVTRQTLYAMEKNGNYEIKTLLMMCKAVGFRIYLVPEEERKPNNCIEIDDI